jgi:hypothetical protein
VSKTKSENPSGPPETDEKLRVLFHDLSDALETILQAAYLLEQRADENNKKWIQAIDKAAREAAHLNREIRETLKTRS